MSKVRLDVLLVVDCEQRKARASIMAGVVYVNGIREDKPGARFERDVEISVKRDNLTSAEEVKT